MGAAAIEADDADADLVLRFRREVPDRLVAGRARTDRAHLRGEAARQLRGVGLRLRGRKRGESQAQAGEGAVLEEISATGVCWGAHGA